MITFSLIVLIIGITLGVFASLGSGYRDPMKLSFTFNGSKKTYYVNRAVGTAAILLWGYLLIFALPFATIALVGLVVPVVEFNFPTWIIVLAVFWLTGFYSIKK